MEWGYLIASSLFDKLQMLETSRSTRGATWREEINERVDM